MTKSLDYTSYVRDLENFVKRSDDLFDEWKLIKDPEVYASRVSRMESGLRLEHHILYSPSYQTPVMYFRAYDVSGQLVTDAETVVDGLNAAAFSYNPDKQDTDCNTKLPRLMLAAAGLTQMPHPLRGGTPFFQVHPCKTAEWMANCPATTNYVISWLSHVAPAVGISDLSNSYFTDITSISSSSE